MGIEVNRRPLCDLVASLLLLTFVVAASGAGAADALTGDGGESRDETRGVWPVPRSRFAIESEVLGYNHLSVTSESGFSASPRLGLTSGRGGLSYAYKVHPNWALLTKTSLGFFNREQFGDEENVPLLGTIEQSFGAEAGWAAAWLAPLMIEFVFGAAIGPSLAFFDDLKSAGVGVEVRTSVNIWLTGTPWFYGFGCVFHYLHTRAYEASGWNRTALEESEVVLLRVTPVGFIGAGF